METAPAESEETIMEKQVNDFLKENEDKIIVKDIKYSVTEGNFGNPIWKNWTVMVIYENR